MDKISFKEFITPFTNMDTYLKAIMIVKNQNSTLSKNKADVASYIKTMIAGDAMISEIEHFIERVTLLPEMYGLTFVCDQTKFDNFMYNRSCDENKHYLVLKCQVNNCIFCKKISLEPRQIAFSKKALVYGVDRVTIAVFEPKYCRNCENFHFLSYGYDSKTKSKHYYTNAYEQEYFQISSESIFEVNLLCDLLSAILFNHASFRGFAQAYNYRHAVKNYERKILNQKRLTEAFLTYHLNKYFSQLRGDNLISMYFTYIAKV